MAKERKKVKISQAKVVVPKKRKETKKQKSKVEDTPVQQEQKSLYKTVRIAEDAKIEDCKEISDRVHRQEIYFAYYAVDGSKGYRYYFVNKKNNKLMSIKERINSDFL
jgi:hypothetical protein